MYTVVEFSDGLELVATSWIQGEDCLYPPYLSQDRKNLAVEQLETPGPKWRTYRIKRIFGKADTYEQGQIKVARAFNQSDINTDCGEDNYSDVQEIDKSPKRKIHKKKRPLIEQEGNEGRKRQATSTPKTSLPPLPRLSFDSGPSTSTSNIIETLSDILKVLNFLKDSLKEFRNTNFHKLNKISHRVSAIEDRLAEKDQELSLKEVCPLEGCFPLKKLEELLEVEKKLSNADYHAQLVNSFKGLGGKDLYAVITTILKKYMDDEVAELFSWSGQKKKMPFKDLSTVKVVMDAVRTHRPGVTEAEVSEIVSKWLVQAKQRIQRAAAKQAKNMPGSGHSLLNDGSVDA